MKKSLIKQLIHAEKVDLSASIEFNVSKQINDADQLTATKWIKNFAKSWKKKLWLLLF